MRKVLIGAAVASLFSFGAVASGDTGSLELSYTFNVEGALDCEILSAPKFELGEITHTGFITTEQELVFNCSTGLNFGVVFDEQATHTGDFGGIYEDEYIHVYLGVLNGTDSNGDIFTRGYPRDHLDLGCEKGPSSAYYSGSVRINNYSLFPIGGDTQLYSQNRNACFLRQGVSEDGEYRVRMTTIVEVKEIPPFEEIENLPTDFVVPVTIYATYG